MMPSPIVNIAIISLALLLEILRAFELINYGAEDLDRLRHFWELMMRTIPEDWLESGRILLRRLLNTLLGRED